MGKWALGTFRKSRTTVTVGIAVLLLAACADDSDAPDVDDAETEASPSADPEEDESADADPDEGDPDAQDESFTLTYTTHNAESAALAQMPVWFLDRVEERTEGRVQFERFFAGSLLGANEVLPGLNDGRVDTAFVAMFYEPSRMPLWQVTGIPFLTDNVEAQMLALDQLYAEDEAFRSEFEAAGIHVLNFVPVGSTAAGLNEPIESLSQLQGERIRSGGYLANALEAAGANAVSMPFQELYEALQRDAVDGYSATPFDTIIASGLHEVRPHVTHLQAGLFASAATGISIEVWDSLPQDLRDEVEGAADDYRGAALEILAETEAETCQGILDAGGSVTILPDSELEEWIEQMGDGPLEAYLDHSESSGFARDDALAFYERFVELLEEHTVTAQYTDGMRACATG